MASAGPCRRSYDRTYHSDTYFGGHPGQVLAPDHRCGRRCGAGNWRAVHHRRLGLHHPDWLVTLSAACQARRYWLPEAAVRFWEELHPAAPHPLQFAFPAGAA